MKVLYVSGATGADYQCDLVMHGLRSLLGPDLVDVNKMWFMYDTSEHYMFHSLYKLLPDIEVDRGEVEEKIRRHHFDAVVFGSAHRCRSYLDLVASVYPASKIAFIDGEDGPELCGDALGRGWYWKRELYSPDSRVMPIQFGIPKEKIRPIDMDRKNRGPVFAPCNPMDRSTYQYYDSETRYYDQYSDAWFGITMRKGGWDCMRHYEIIASGTVPYFIDIEQCPPDTLALLPRDPLLRARRLADPGRWQDSDHDRTTWWWIMDELHQVLVKHLTTEAHAKRILEKLSQ